MRYETVFILTPVLSEAQVEEAAKKHLDFIKDLGAKVLFQENWGLKKLAYPIVSKQNGFYYLVEFESQGDIVHKLELEFKRDERILRYLTVKLDKHGVDWAEKRRVKIKSN
jgi:small subunit ribosomal protein S6